MHSGARWFYAIAALSFVTSIVSLVGGRFAFLVSLGVTQIIDALVSKGGGTAKIIALALDAMAAGVFAILGYFASKRQSWAFIAGMALYALDALLFVFIAVAFDALDVAVFLAVAFHVYAFYHIFNGYRACARLTELDKEASIAAIPPPPTPAP
jgi:hypothetical protein